MLQAKIYFVLFMVIGFFGVWKPFAIQQPLPFITGISSVCLIFMCIALFSKAVTLKAFKQNQLHLIALGHFLCSFYFRVLPIILFWQELTYTHWLMSLSFFILVDCGACLTLVDLKRKPRHHSHWILS